MWTEYITTIMQALARNFQRDRHSPGPTFNSVLPAYETGMLTTRIRGGSVKSEGKKLRGRSKLRWKGNIKINFN